MESVAGQGDPRAQQHGGPDHAVKPGDALSDHVQVGRPEASIPVPGEPGGGDVVDEGVEPDVDGLARIAGKWNAPRDPLPGDGHVLQSAFDQAQHLVAPDRRLDRELPAADQREQPLPVPAQPEEPVPLVGGHEVETRMLDAVAVLDLRPGLVLLAAGAIEAFVVALEQVAVGHGERRATRARRGPRGSRR